MKVIMFDLSTIIDISSMVLCLLMMLFPKTLVRHVNKFQKKHQVRPLRIVERIISKHEKSRNKEMETKLVNVVDRIQIIVVRLAGAFFFVMSILSLLGVLDSR